MAKGPRLSGQVAPLTEEEIAAAQEAEIAKIKAGLLDQANTAGTLGLEGQDTGPQDGPPIALPSETIAENLRDIQVTPQESQLAAQAQPEPSPEVQEQPQLQPMAQEVSQANQEKFALTPEQQLERENIRVPSVMEAAGVARDLSNLHEQVGDKNYSRFRQMVSINEEGNVDTTRKLGNEYVAPIPFDVPTLLTFDSSLEVSDPSFQEKLSEINKEAFEVEDINDRPLRVSTKGSPLKLNRANILLSDKVLGIGIKNPLFDPSKIELNEKGRVSNRSETNQQPFKIDARYIPTIAAVVEDMLVSTQRDTDAASANDMDQPPITMADMDSVDPTAAEVYREEAGKASLGRSLFQALRREKGYFAGEPTDTYMEDFKNTTPETFEAIADTMLDLYASIAPHMVTVTEGGYNLNTGESGARSYALSPEGYLQLQESRVRVPDFKAQFLTLKPYKGTIPFEGVLLKTETGAIPNPESKALAEAKVNTSNVTNVIDSRRGSIALMLGVHAYATAVKQPEGNLESANFTLNMMDMGSNRMNKITSIARAQDIKMQVAQSKIDSILSKSKLTIGDSIKLSQLEGEVQFRKNLKEKYKLGAPLEGGTNELQALYYQHANKNLETLSFIARNGDKPFYHTYVTQKGSTRLTTAQYLSFQNSHLMRNVIGSGAKVEIKPMRGGEIEDNFLWSASTIFFDGGGKVKETAVKNALFHIKNKTPRYQSVVKMGGRLKGYLNMFDKDSAVASLGQVTSTPQGIKGLEGLTGTLPQAMLDDKELMGFLTAIGESKDSHKHAIQYLDYLMAMSEYDQAMRDGTSFHTSVNGVEIDGISNGLSSFFVMLGQYDKLPRIGVTRAEGSEEVLGMWKDLPNALTIPEAYAGNIRKTLSETLRLNMGNEVSSLAMFDKSIMQQFGYTEADIPKLREILEVALKESNTSTFLKSPILTFPYGQETKNLIGSIYETIVGDPELYAEILGFFGEGGLPKGAKFLDTIRMQALRTTLGNDVMAFSRLSKEAVDLAGIYNQFLSIQNPAGGESMFVGKETRKTGRSTNFKATARVDRESGTQEVLAEDFKRRRAKAASNNNQEAVAKLDMLIQQTEKPRPMRVDEKESFLSPLASRRGITGGVAHGSVLPNIAQGIDGAAIVKTFSGPAWKALNKTANGDAWVLPVYDAVITDLRSMGKLTSVINNQWFNMTSESTILDEMVEGLNKKVKQGKQEFSKLAQKGGMINEQEHGALADHIINVLKYAKLDKGKKKIAEGIMENLYANYAEQGAQINSLRNYRTLYEAQLFLETEAFNRTAFELSGLAKKSKEGRAEVRKKVNADKEAYGHEVLQYSMDNIGIPKEAKTLLDS